jgi:CRISPR/Cas system-associated exonuclease Cas4 (RecB family)
LENSKTLTLSQQALGHLHLSRSDSVADSIQEVVDEAILKGKEKREKRTYIGASSIGDECPRKIQYRFMGYPQDEEKAFSARTLRIFQFGHQIEDYMAKWLRDAKFDLRTEDKNGKQFGFSIADDQIKGHIDGVVCGGPIDMAYPALWESKSANDSKFKSFVRHGVAKANSVYATQIALYQSYMDLTENPCLFTVVNKNTSEIYYELVPFDKKLAQEASDRAVNILTATKANEILPRIAQNKDFFLCKFCEYRNVCWAE